MTARTLIDHIQFRSRDHILMIWRQLIALTVLSTLVAESDRPSVAATLIVCGVVLLKGHGVIEHFMGLKHAAPVTRWIITSYFYLMTIVVALSFIYSQSLVVH